MERQDGVLPRHDGPPPKKGLGLKPKWPMISEQDTQTTNINDIYLNGLPILNDYILNLVIYLWTTYKKWIHFNMLFKITF